MDVTVKPDCHVRYEQILALIDSLGCHLSWHELSPVSKDKTRLGREKENLALEKWDFCDRPTYYTAIRNLQGFIAYNLDELDEAQSFFEGVLDKDGNNLNALANLAYITKGIGKLEDNRHFVDRLVEILSRPSCYERARAHADKAHAIRYFEPFKRCLKYMRYIKLAATIGSKCDGPHRAEWFFDYALALYRRDLQILYLRKLHAETDEPLDNSDCYSDAKIKEGFINACKQFMNVATISLSEDYQALSWVFLGILVNHDPEHRSLGEVFPEKPEYHLTPEQCFEKGLGIHPEHEIVLRRVGSEYVKLKRFEEAKQLLDKSLGILPSRYGYRYRAFMYLKMYEESVEDGNAAVDRLYDAASDLQNALKKKEAHADISDLGYVYYLLGDNDKASFMFLRATSSEQFIDYDYFDQVLAHRRWAVCLEKANELAGSQHQLQKAKEIRKQILDTALQEEQLDVFFQHDFEHYNTNEKQGFVRVLMDYHFWRPCSKLSDMGTCLPRGSSDRYAYDFDVFVWHTDTNRRWAVAFVNKLEMEHNIKCCIGGRDFQLGKEIQKNILDCLRLSHRCVIILPGSQSWMRFTIAHAIRELYTREDEFILPIKLIDCPVPVELQHLTVRDCEEGQIKQEHWDEIVKLCRQI
ncbi:uncharacterized protein LOC117299998 [Asterias rubens]|uniref:uncharacterized protein LOC117299998 n=1 Tax=Asterias rubens TaxID=7604 RepID=UPI0014555AD1|nr:uncharacterized protein LOC117299998 [Asterias rubens]